MLPILMAIILFTRAIYSISTDNSTFIQANQTQQQNNSNKTTQYTVMPKLSRSVKDKFLVVQMQQALPKRCNPDGTRTVTKKVCHKDKCKILYFKIKVKKCQGISHWDSLSVCLIFTLFGHRNKLWILLYPCNVLPHNAIRGSFNWNLHDHLQKL